MIDQTGTISIDGKVKGQIQIITDKSGAKRVQLYNTKGVFLCESPFTGNDERGFEQGQSMYIGYMAAWENAKAHFTKAALSAMNMEAITEIA